jgi:hypothetical protein
MLSLWRTHDAGMIRSREAIVNSRRSRGTFRSSGHDCAMVIGFHRMTSSLVLHSTFSLGFEANVEAGQRRLGPGLYCSTKC